MTILLGKNQFWNFCGEETSRVDQPSAIDSVISSGGVPQEGLCPDIQVPTTEIAGQKDPGSTSDIHVSIEQSRSDELSVPCKSTELGRMVATNRDVPKVASLGSG